LKIELSPQQATLIVALLALVTAIVSAVVSSWLTRRREDRTEERQARKEKATATRALYEEAITVFNTQIETLCMNDAEFGDRLHALKAKMALAPRRDIEALFYETGDLVDRWAANQREANPKPLGGGLVMIKSSNMTEKYRVEAERLKPLVFEKFEQLKNEMANDIAAIENAPLQRSKLPLPHRLN
jgi:hypothetical protein